MRLWAVLAILYGLVVIVIAAQKPEKIWKMKKIELFKKYLGDTGTEIFFYVWALMFLVLGVWLFGK